MTHECSDESTFIGKVALQNTSVQVKRKGSLTELKIARVNNSVTEAIMRIRDHLLEKLVKWTIFNGWTKWKSCKLSFSRNVRIHGSRHWAGDRCHAMPSRQQSRTVQARAVHKWHVRAQKTSSYITACLWVPGLIVGPCPSEESLCCPACPPPSFHRFPAPGL